MQRYNVIIDYVDGQGYATTEADGEGDWVRWEDVELEISLMQATIDLLRLGIR